MSWKDSELDFWLSIWRVMGMEIIALAYCRARKQTVWKESDCLVQQRIDVIEKLLS